MTQTTNNTEPLILGIDGGGTKTLGFLATADGAVIGRGQAPSSNYHKVGQAAALAALSAVVDAAWVDAHLTPAPIAAVCLGLAGVDRPEDIAVFTPWLEQRFPGAPWAIVNDAELALAAGVPNGWGVGVICGTGSICVGRSQEGRYARADGWGHFLGDEGSGYAIGLSALHAIMRAYDGRDAATLLTQAVLEAWKLQAVENLVHRVYVEHATPTEIAALAAIVDQAAADGDGVALAILEKAADELAISIVAVARRLELDEAVPCALAGGVLTKSQRMTALVTAAVARRGVTLQPVTQVTEPAMGAIRLAQRLASQRS